MVKPYKHLVVRPDTHKTVKTEAAAQGKTVDEYISKIVQKPNTKK